MVKMANDLIRISAVGGGMIVDAEDFMTNDLIRIAGASDNKIIIRNADCKMTNDLIRIAAAGKGNVIFDLT